MGVRLTGSIGGFEVSFAQNRIASLGEERISPMYELGIRLRHELDPDRAVNEAHTLFLTYARKILENRLADASSSKEEAVSWGLGFLQEATKVRIDDDLLIKSRLFMVRHLCTNTQLSEIETLVDGRRDVSRIKAADELVTFVLENRQQVSKILDDLEVQVQFGVRATSDLEATIASGIFQRLFPSNAASVRTTFRSHLDRLVCQLVQTKKTQWQVFGHSEENAVFMKVRYGESKVEVLVSKPVGLGTFKTVFGVIRCAEAGLLQEISREACSVTQTRNFLHQRVGVYAYAKSDSLRAYRNKFNRLQQHYADNGSMMRWGAIRCIQADLHNLSAVIREIEEGMRLEVELASAVPSAVSMEVVYKRHRPTEIKGIAMEYMDGGTLFERTRRTPYPVCDRDSIGLAIQLCQAVADMHRCGIVHMDIKSNNVLLSSHFQKGEADRVTLKLIDFGAAKRIGPQALCHSRVSTYPAPEVVVAELRPVPYDYSMDAWSLGITIFELAYGSRLAQKIIDTKTGRSRPLSEILATIESIPGSIPEVAAVIVGLLQDEPTTRWSAQKATDELQRVKDGPKISWTIF